MPDRLRLGQLEASMATSPESSYPEMVMLVLGVASAAEPPIEAGLVRRLVVVAMRLGGDR
jgi:hypothetical protein